jgi:uncharacterized membrane protein
MLNNIISNVAKGGYILTWIEYAALIIEMLAVIIIFVSIFFGVIRYSFQGFFKTEDEERYNELKLRLGRSLLLGLEILVAADIIRTVALEATIESVLVLGILVVIRTFLSWSLEVEIEGHWPWKRTK